MILSNAVKPRNFAAAEKHSKLTQEGGKGRGGLTADGRLV